MNYTDQLYTPSSSPSPPSSAAAVLSQLTRTLQSVRLLLTESYRKNGGAPRLFYSSVKCTGAPKYPYKDILVHRCTSPMNKTMHPAGCTSCSPIILLGQQLLPLLPRFPCLCQDHIVQHFLWVLFLHRRHMHTLQHHKLAPFFLLQDFGTFVMQIWDQIHLVAESSRFMAPVSGGCVMGISLWMFGFGPGLFLRKTVILKITALVAAWCSD